MRISLLASILLGLVTSIHAAEPQVEGVKVQGTWRPISVIVDGKDFTLPPGMQMDVTEGRWTMRLDGQVIQEGTATGDRTSTPLRAKVVITAGADAGKVTQQISMIIGDVMIACARVGEKPPTEFKSLAGSGNILSVWMRVE